MIGDLFARHKPVFFDSSFLRPIPPARHGATTMRGALAAECMYPRLPKLLLAPASAGPRRWAPIHCSHRSLQANNHTIVLLQPEQDRRSRRWLDREAPGAAIAGAAARRVLAHVACEPCTMPPTPTNLALLLSMHLDSFIAALQPWWTSLRASCGISTQVSQTSREAALWHAHLCCCRRGRQCRSPLLLPPVLLPPLLVPAGRCCSCVLATQWLSP